MVATSGCAAALVERPKPPAAREPAPARLSVEAAPGASVRIDGRLVGVAPLSAPLEVEPGERVVSVTRRGAIPAESRLALAPGESKNLSVELADTPQRTAAWALLATSGVAVAAGIALGVVAVLEQREAREIEDDAGGRELLADEQRARDEALATRDEVRVGAGLAAGTGLALFLVGGALFVFDEPAFPAPTVGPAAAGASVLPVAAPGYAGAAAALRF